MKTQNTDYNGWKNYQTWRVALEFFDGTDHYDDYIAAGNEDISELAACLREEVEEYLSQMGSGLALDYALAFLHECSYYEIAEHLIEEYKEKLKHEEV